MFQESLHRLKEVCGVKEVLPRSCILSEPLLGCVYEGTFKGSKVRVRRIRVYPGADPQKVREVCTRSHVSRASDAHEPYRHFTRWLQCRNTWPTQTSSPSLVRRSTLSNSSRIGCRAETFQGTSQSIPIQTGCFSCVFLSTEPHYALTPSSVI